MYMTYLYRNERRNDEIEGVKSWNEKEVGNK